MKHATPLPRHRRAYDPPPVIPAVPAQRAASDSSLDDRDQQRWRARPRAALLVRLAVVVIPLIAGVGCAALVSRVLPHADGAWRVLLWWLVVVGTSMAVLLLVDRVARRLLPLALLLRLSMLFPDQAPKRYRVAARAWNSRRLEEQVTRQRISGVYDSDSSLAAATQILALMANLASHDRRTRGHCERVRVYNDLLAEELGLSSSDRDRLRWAALIHDIGKLKVSQRLLNKPDLPTESEWAILRAHPMRGAEIAAPLSDWLHPWTAAIEQHHERWDGTGYPHGVAGNEINFGARIVAVADAFEVMTSIRPYGRPMSAERARAEIAACAGTQFDPIVVRAFLTISLGQLRKAMGALMWLSLLPLFARMPRASAAVQSGSAAIVGTGLAVVVAIGPATTSAHHGAGLPVVPAAATTSPPVSIVVPPMSPRTPRPTASAAPTPARHGPTQSRVVGQLPGSAGTVAEVGTTHLQPPTTVPPTSQPSAPPPSSGSAQRGRCAGNSGAGAGNGGATGSPTGGKGIPSRARTGLQHAAGLNACP